MDFIASGIDFGGHKVTINIGTGSFAGVGSRSTVGGGTLAFLGNGSVNTIINAGDNDFVTNAGEPFCFAVPIASTVTIDKLTIAPNGSGVSFINDAVDVFATATLRVAQNGGDVVIDCTGLAGGVGNGDFAFWMNAPGTNWQDNGLTFTGGGATFDAVFQIESGVQFTLSNNGAQPVFNGNAHAGAFAKVDQGAVLVTGDTAGWVLSGSVTGVRFIVGSFGYLGVTAGQAAVGPNYWPGNVAGRCDPSSFLDQFPRFASEVGPPSSASVASHFVDGTWFVHKDTVSGARKIAVNDGGTIYVSQIGRNVNTQTASYTLVISDQDGRVEMNAAGANTLTVPTNASVAFPVGTEIRITQVGAGATTIAGAVGVTGDNFGAIGGQWKSALIYKRGTDEWVQTTV